MTNDKLPFRVRVASFIAGTSMKSVIPSLGPLDGQSIPGRIQTFDTANEQIAANIGWAFSANSAITDPTAAVQLTLWKKKPDGDREEIKQHEILDLLNAPHAALTGEQMRNLHFSYLNFTGESYLYMHSGGAKEFTPARNKLPAAIEIFPSQEVSFKLGATWDQSTVRRGSKDYPITSFIREIRPSLRNPYAGQSIIQAAAQTLDMEGQMKTWNQNLFANGARPSIVFKTNEPLTDEAYGRWKEQFADRHTGAGNAFKPLLIEGGDVSPYMMSQQDMDFLNSRKFSRDEILAMFKVSPGMVGIVENVNRANLDAGFYINAIINVVPRIRQFVAVLNATLISQYDPSLELGYVNPVPEDIEAKLAYAKAAAGNTAWLSVDEVRDIYGEKALENNAGVHVLVPGTIRTLETAIEDKTDPTALPVDTEGEEEDTGKKPAKEDDKAKALPDSLAGVKKKTMRLRRALNVATRR